MNSFRQNRHPQCVHAANVSLKSRLSKYMNVQWVIAALILCVCSFMQCAYSQTTFGSVVGNVTDNSGAALAGAQITLTNVGTNEARKMSASTSGVYSFADLQPGRYKLDVDAPGFRHFTLTGIEVLTGGTTRANAAMQVGEVSQTIEVTSAAPLIQTDSANLGGVIEGRTVQTIPLNGRNVNNLLELVPGVQPGGSTSGNISTNQIAYGNYQIGGGFGNQSAFYIDGVLSQMPSNNAVSMIPAQDTVHEFQVTTSDVSAEFGGFAGGVVNITTKSGTNDFHGSAYEYHRNRVLNANDFFSNRNGRARPSWIQNQYGLTIGGPVVRNKAFFFGGFEREPVVNGNLSTTTVPTAAEMNGDFSAAGLPKIYDPTTGQQFQCNGVLNVICPNRIDPAVAAILKLNYPAQPSPNPAALSNNYITTTRTRYLLQSIDARIDFNTSAKNALFGRYTQFTSHSITTPAYPNIPAWKPSGPGGIDDYQAIVGDTYTLNSTTIFDGRLSYLRAYQYAFPRGLGTDTSGISPGLAATQAALGQKLPVSLSFSGTPINGGVPPGQLYWFENMYMISGSMTKILGRHTIKAGGMVRQAGWIAIPESGGIVNTFSTRATSNANAAGTGFSLASGLLGIPDSTNAQAIGGSRAFMHNYGFFVTDKFQMSQKLTVDAGVRWDQPGSYSEVNDWNTVILPTAPSPIGTINNTALGTQQTLTGNLALVNSSQFPGRREENLHWMLFSPRVGFAYRLNNQMVVRSGYGISYLPATLSQDGPNSSSVNTARTTLNNVYAANSSTFSQVNTTVANPFPNGVLTPGRHDASRLSSLYGQNIQSRLPNQPFSYVQQWNIGVERQFGNSASISAAYGGARGVHLQAQGANTWSAFNINQLPDQYLSLGADLETQVPNPFLHNAQIDPKDPLYSAATVMKGTLLLPHPQYFYMTAAGDRNSSSFYYSLQVGYKERFAHDGILAVAYTWARLYSNTDTITQFLEGGDSYQGTVQNNNNLPGEWSLSSSDFPQNLTIGYGIDLPVGKGQRLLKDVHGPVGVVISGWRVNGVTMFRSGQPLGLLANPSDIAKYFGGGGYYQNGIGQGTTRPNYTAGCNKEPVSGDLAKVNAKEWFNQTCFTQPGTFAFGNEPRTDPTLRRAGIKNFDFSLQKQTKIGERVTFSFTSEFYNLFNRVQFAAPGMAFYDGANFGAVTAQANNPRQIQFGGRFEF